MTERLGFDLYDPANAEDPYPTFARLRSTHPVGRSDGRADYWYLADYEDVRMAFRSPDLFSSAEVRIPYVDDHMGKEIPLQLDGAAHARWRDLLDPLFSLRRIEKYRDLVTAEARDLIGRFVEEGGGDLVQMFAVPYPSRIFCILMGLPPQSLDQYLRWNRDLSHGTDMENRAAVVANFIEAKKAVRRFFEDLKEERIRSGPRDDVVSALIAARLDGRPITDDEFHNVCVLLFIAGLETVTATLGNFFWFLAEHPDHRRRLVADPSLVPSAVEELLRYESIVAPGRVATTDAELGGCPVRAGDRIMLLTGSAGRDEKVFDVPEQVIFGRSPNRHLAFGGGPHRCLGSHLARMELRIALEEMCRQMPEFTLDSNRPVVRSLGQIKGVESLPLVVWGDQQGMARQ